MEDYWFGGGVDLTPYYVFEEDCKTFHEAQKLACVKHVNIEFFNSLKKACDSYFYLPHRKEHRFNFNKRGIGGTFFNDIILENSFEKTIMYVKDAAYNYLKGYQ